MIEWVKVSERLPEKSGYYIVSTFYGGSRESFEEIKLFDQNKLSFGMWHPDYSSTKDKILYWGKINKPEFYDD